MSKIEILIRFRKEKTKEELEEEKENIRIKKLTMGDDYEPDEEGEEDWSYGRGIVDLKDIEMVNDLDNQHITIRLYSGKAFVIKVNYDVFVETYEFLTGCKIFAFENETNIQIKENG